MFAQRLRLARKKAGLSMQKLGDSLSPRISAQSISKYESGKMLPSSSVLVALGKALDVSLDFLMSSQIENFDGLEFRKHSRTTARDRAKAEATLTEHLENYLATESILGIKNDIDWLTKVQINRLSSLDDLEAKTAELRHEWNLGLEPILSLTELLEEKGIKVISDDLPKDINGLGCSAMREGCKVAEAVLVSKDINVERRRFTLAHELAHRIVLSTGNRSIKLEVAMNRFAGAFLVPAPHLRTEIGDTRNRITYYEIVRLKHTYGVSAAAILVRLGQIGIMRKESVQYAFRTFARSWRKSEPEPIQPDEGFAEFEKPRRLKRLVSRALGEELISPLRAATLLNMSLDDVEREIIGPNS